MMKTITLWVGIVLLLVGCGQKGALYLPEKPSKKPAISAVNEINETDVNEQNLQENHNDY